MNVELSSFDSSSDPLSSVLVTIGLQQIDFLITSEVM